MAEKADKIRTVSRSRQASPASHTSFIHTKGDHNFFSSPATSTSFIQPKLQVSQPGDPMEKEADNTAERVMRMSEPTVQAATTTPPEDELQRKCDSCEKEDKLQRKEEDEEVQAKLSVNNSGVLVQRVEEKEEPVQTKMEDDEVHRRCEKCEKEDKIQPSLLQRVADDDKKEQETTVHPKLTFLSRKERGPPRTSPRFVNDLHSSSNNGRAMDNGTRSFMESRFSADFSQVKVHTDASAVQLSSQISAQAFTHGSNIYFNSGKYNPNTESGKHLLAHELTHTIQQGKSPTLNDKVDRKVEPALNTGTASVCEQYSPAPQSDTKPTSSSEVSETETVAAPPVPTPQSTAVTKTKTQPEAKPMAAPPAPTADTANTKEAPKKVTDGDTQFHDLVKETKTKAKGQRKHDEPVTKTDEAQQKANVKDDAAVTSAAMVLTTNENVTTEKPKEFSAEDFKKQLKQKIEEKVPNDEKQAKEFIKNDNKVNEIVSNTKGNIKESQKDVTQNAENISNEQTVNSDKRDVIAQRPGGELTVEEPGKRPGVGEAERAVPKPVAAEDVQMDKEHDADSLDKEMAANKMTDNQLAESEEKSFTDTLELKQQSQQELCSVPAKLRNAENTQHEADTKATQGEITHGLNSMHNQRSGQFNGVQETKKNTQTAEEIQLMLYYNNLKLIYIATETSVKNRLDKLDEEVTSKFQEAIDKAFGTFKQNVTSRLDYYYDWHVVRRDYEKEDKFTRMTNSAFDQRIIELRWQQLKLKPDDPKWKSLEAEIRMVGSKRQKLIIEQIFEEEKALFISTVNVAIDEIAIIVANGLNDAKAIIKNGEDQTMKAYGTLSDENKKKAEEATGDFMAKYKDLDQKVNDKEGELVEAMSKQYADSVSKLKQTFEDIRAEAALKWWERAWRKIKEIALIIYNLGKTLLNILVKAASVIGDILAHPIRFFGNLIDGIGLGFKNFIKNLPKHLEEVMFKLILGAVPPDLKLPEKWDAAGIFSFILDFFGLSKANIRKQAVDYFSEPVVQKLEQAFDLFIIFREKGFAGLWEYVKEKIGDLKNAIIEEVKTFFKEAIIEAAIKYLISMLTPASGFIKVCLSIIGVIKFFFTQLVNLLKLLDSILDSMIDIVNGRIENAAKRVESALADLLLIGIKFLAALVGINLDKIQAKVSKIINAVRNPVNRAIKWLFDKAKAFAEKTGLLKLIKKGQQKIEAGKEWAKEKVEQGKTKVGEVKAALLEWWKTKKEFRTRDGQTHKIYFESENSSEIMLQSQVQKVSGYFTRKEAEISNIQDKTKKKDKTDALKDARKAYDKARNLYDEIKKLEGKTDATQKDKEDIKKKSESVREQYNIVGDKIGILGIDDETKSKVLSNLEVKKADANGNTKIIEADPLTPIPGNTRGSARTGQFIRGWKHLDDVNTHSTDPAVKGKVFNDWLRMHLIHEDLNGPANQSNLVPANTQPNTALYNAVESPCVDKNRDPNSLLWYKTEVTYRTEDPAKSYIKDFPSNIKMSWGEQTFDDKNNKWIRGNAIKSKDANVNEPPGLTGVVKPTGIQTFFLRDATPRKMFRYLRPFGLAQHVCERIANAYLHGTENTLRKKMIEQYNAKGYYNDYFSDDWNKINTLDQKQITNIDGIFIIDLSV